MLRCGLVLFAVASLLLWWSRRLQQNPGGRILLQLDWRMFCFGCVARDGEYSLLHDVQDCTWPVAAVCIVFASVLYIPMTFCDLA